MRTLLRTTGFVSYIAVVFLNAFIDLGHKIIIQNTVFKVYDGDTQIMLTAIVNALILLPFILLFSPAGFISDKYPKNRVMRIAAWAAVGLTLAITACYYQGWFIPAFCMTFLLAVQSAFYSPAKYGYIKIMLGKERLGEGNGAVQAVTIIAILLGTFAYSILFEYRYDPSMRGSEDAILRAIAPVGWMLVANSLIQLFFAYRVPELEREESNMSFDWRGYMRGSDIAENLRPVWRQPMIRYSIGGLMIFWSISQVMLATFPAFAKESLGQTNTVVIQGTLAASGIGIMLGSLLAGRWSRHHIEVGLIPLGAAGFTLGLVFIPQIETNLVHVLNFIMIGVMGGFFIVPLNALIQFHAKDQEMGKVLAGNNLIQNIGMLGFLTLTVLLSYLGASAVLILGLLVLVALAGSLYTVFKLPLSLVRLLLGYRTSRRCRLRVQGMRNIPERGGMLLLGNSISWLDWTYLQIASPRPIRFVMAVDVCRRWRLGWYFKLIWVIPVEDGADPGGVGATISGLLARGETVCLLTKEDYTIASALGEAVIVPFYLHDIQGPVERDGKQGRGVIVAFGPALPCLPSLEQLERRLDELSVATHNEYLDSAPAGDTAW